MPVMTRKATTQDMELKLRTALQELKASQLQCQQLLQESEECEEEVRKIINKNSILKRELVDLNQQYLNVVDERDQLQVITGSFNNCSNLYEEALSKVRDLEDELFHANSCILKLQNEKECTRVEKTNNLFNELVGSNCNPHPLVTIDLTENSMLKLNSSYKVSQKKIKRYAKLNRIIRKCYQFKKHQKHYLKNIQLRKDRINLINKLNNYQIKLEDSKTIYEIDTQRLQAELQVLENSLSSLYTKYVASTNQIKEHILAANELVSCQCTCQKVTNLDAVQLEETEDPSQAERFSQNYTLSQDVTDMAQDLQQVEQPEVNSSQSCSTENCYHSVIFSDSIGRGLGKLVCNNLSHSSVNYCTPQTSYKQIMSSVARNKFDKNTIITVFVGNSFNVKKDDITDSVTELLKINCKKIILCAFPYFENLSNRQNMYIHMLNNHIQFLVSHHCDKFLFLDTNIFVDKLKSTRDSVYLPISFRRQIARLLVFNINPDISTMSKYSIISTTISNSTNVKVFTNNNLN